MLPLYTPLRFTAKVAIHVRRAIAPRVVIREVMRRRRLVETYSIRGLFSQRHTLEKAEK